MDDLRFEWIRDRVYDGLGLRKAAIFEQFMEQQEAELATFLNNHHGPLDEFTPCSSTRRPSACPGSPLLKVEWCSFMAIRVVFNCGRSKGVLSRNV